MCIHLLLECVANLNRTRYTQWAETRAQDERHNLIQTAFSVGDDGTGIPKREEGTSVRVNPTLIWALGFVQFMYRTDVYMGTGLWDLLGERLGCFLQV